MSAASGVDYAKPRGATYLLNWTERLASTLLGAPSCAPCSPSGRNVQAALEPVTLRLTFACVCAKVTTTYRERFIRSLIYNRGVAVVSYFFKWSDLASGATGPIS